MLQILFSKLIISYCQKKYGGLLYCNIDNIVFYCQVLLWMKTVIEEQEDFLLLSHVFQTIKVGVTM